MSAEVTPDPTGDLKAALKGLQGAYVALVPATYSAAVQQATDTS
ncbi:hypothetical protein GCM10010495_49130 [Kitasatospora herbaricolor]|nr:hypothetical protein [Kitasatospora herbaricolor]MDQ0305720.1 hypothetical protein [Kitasatospora herbaricolor]GGV27210.1 hypothetical protein GCM10010495_49130 [Kitasatospora herbaricolor]